MVRGKEQTEEHSVEEEKKKGEAPVGKTCGKPRRNRRKAYPWLLFSACQHFSGFAAAIVYTAGLLTAEANERLEQERCYQLAKSYAKALDTELTSYTRKTERNQYYLLWICQSFSGWQICRI